MALASQALQFQLGEDPAVAILKKVGDILDDIDIGGADVMVGVFEPPEFSKTLGGIVVPDAVRKEYQYQGITGLVLKMGPYAYRGEKTTNWFLDKDNDPNPIRVGDWVAFAFSQGSSFLMRKQPIRLVNDQHILMRIPRPDLVM